jgi:diketogulonate reductase-like aldo/keto reductase
MITRRQLLQVSAAILALPLHSVNSATRGLVLKRSIPSSGEQVPVVGMGSSRTFNVDSSPQKLAQLGAIMKVFFDHGGAVIDSSPMYGSAEARIGDVLRNMAQRPDIFAATKVWTNGRESGIEQMLESSRRMNVERFDLIAVHNLVDWKTQLATLKQWKAEGKVRYIGITTSHGRYHDELLDIMRREPLDFVQFSYNIDNLDAERSLLPLAADRGIATMINRPYQRGSLFRKSKGKPLPELASEIDCKSWGQFYLKFILGHAAVTCVIPATSKEKHMRDNMQANFGRLPSAAQRAEMLRIFRRL